jgi:hypothetical protein
MADKLKIGDRFEIGTRRKPRNGTIVAVSNKGDVVLVEWNLGGSSMDAFDTIHWFDQPRETPA